MDVSILGRGLVVGFAIAAPVGPIGLLCIQRTLQQGRLNGLVSGLGAATADAVYGSIAGFGLTLVSSFMLRQQTWLGFFGGIFLCYLGLRIFVSRPATAAAGAPRGTLVSAYLSTLLLTLTNPVTILAFVGIFAGLGLGSGSGGYLAASSLVIGVFLGSAAWWLLLSGSVSLLRTRIDAASLGWLNRLAGSVIVVFGLWALLRSGQ